MTEDMMRETDSALSQLIVALALRGVHVGTWPRVTHWHVWLGEDPAHPVACAQLSTPGAIVTWLAAQAKQHYGIDRREHGE